MPSSLLAVTSAFLDLYTARHAADYDHLAAFPKARTRGHVEAAERAVDELWANLEDPHVQRFLGLVVFQAARLPRP